MKIVGLTGGIGCGKSTVARLLEARGARLIDADDLARVVVEPGRPAHEDIVREFGESVLNPDRTLDRERLAAVVFGDEDKRRLLNNITHPRIGEEMLRLIERRRREGAGVVLIDAALLLESPATRWIKPVIVVVCRTEVKVDRVCQRDGSTREQVLARVASQWSDEERAGRADFVIENSGTREELEARVEEVWRKISEK